MASSGKARVVEIRDHHQRLAWRSSGPGGASIASSGILQVGSSDGVRRRPNGLTDLEAFELRMIDVE
jgi:hypothetical protein